MSIVNVTISQSTLSALVPSPELAQIIHAGDVRSVADRVRSSVSGDTENDEDSLIQIPIRVSMGVATLEENLSLRELLRNADAALYRAKRAGRDTVSG